MGLFETLSGPYTRRAQRQVEAITGACLYGDKGDQFFADITAEIVERDTEVEIIAIEASFAGIVEISDSVLMDECYRQLERHLNAKYDKDIACQIKTVARI